MEGNESAFTRERNKVAILIVLEQGWKMSIFIFSIGFDIVAILIVLEQGWKAIDVVVYMNSTPLSQSSLYWSRVGS